MSVEENKALARRFAQVWGKGNLETVDELAAPDFSASHPLLERTVYGTEVFKQALTILHIGMPDVDIVIEDEVAEGNRVAVRWTIRGTHTGELLGIRPTGKQLTLTGMTIYHLSDGKVVEERSEEDTLSLLRQLGIIHSKARV